MQQKLCLWLVIVVLLGALAGGNPFLPCCDRESGSPPEPASARNPSGTVVHDASEALAVRDAPAAGAAPASALPSAERALFALDAKPRAPRPAATERSGRAEPVHAAMSIEVPRVGPSAGCPDPKVAPLVVRVERDAAGQPVWVLRDGRRLVRNPRSTGPLLVPAAN